MEKNVNINKSGGIGVLSIITIIFVVLKSFGVINLTWFQCFLPLIIGFGITVVIMLIAFVILLIAK